MNLYVRDPIRCPSCNNFISADSHACLYCGRVFKPGEIKKNENKQILKMAGVASILIFVFESLIRKFVYKK